MLSGKSPHFRLLPLSSEYGAHGTVKARFWPRISDKSPQNVLICHLFAGKRLGAMFVPGRYLESLKRIRTVCLIRPLCTSFEQPTPRLESHQKEESGGRLRTPFPTLELLKSQSGVPPPINFMPGNNFLTWILGMGVLPTRARLGGRSGYEAIS